MNLSTKVLKAIEAIDQINQKDPNTEVWQGRSYSKSWLYSERMSNQLKLYFPEASNALQLAARAHHIGRWNISRTSYPSGKKGYHTWRNALLDYHANTMKEVMQQHDFSNLFIEKVCRMIRKKNLRMDFDTQILEDVICHVFLSFYFTDFAAKHNETKVIDILQKTWKKLSATGQQAVTGLSLPHETHILLTKSGLL